MSDKSALMTAIPHRLSPFASLNYYHHQIFRFVFGFRHFVTIIWTALCYYCHVNMIIYAENPLMLFVFSDFMVFL